MSIWRIIGILCVLILGIEFFTSFIEKQFGSNNIGIMFLTGIALLSESFYSIQKGYVSLKRKRVYKEESPKTFTFWFSFLFLVGLSNVLVGIYWWQK